MDVVELNSNQLMQLKSNLFYGDDNIELTQKQRDCLSYCFYPEEIPDGLVYEVYAGICFVEDDFFD